MPAYVPYDAWRPDEGGLLDADETNNLMQDVLRRRADIAARLPAQVVREIRGLRRVDPPIAISKIVARYRSYGVTGPVVHMLTTYNMESRLRQDVK